MIWGVVDRLHCIRMGDYGEESQCSGVRAIWGVLDHLCHIRTGDNSEESHWVVQGHRGDIAC